MLVSADGHRGYRFGEFMLDLDRGALLKDGEEVPLRPKSFEVLRLLVERQGTLVSREELLEKAWPGVIVTDDSLTQCMIEIRRALGDDDRTLVRTVPRRGFIFEMPVERARRADPAPATPRTDHHASNFAWLLGAFAMLIGAAIGWWALTRTPDTATGPSAARDPAFDPPPRSIAVLAFDDMSPGGDHEWFAEGLSEEVLNLLAQVPELTVIARTSSFAFRDSNADIRTIAERLDVAHVLEGSVRHDGERVRVTAQLVDGVSEAHLWSQSYDRTMGDVFGVQDDIARAVADVLEVELLGRGVDPAVHEPDPQAWAAYLHGHHFYNRRGEGDLARAEGAFREAVEIDPRLARAWIGLAAVYFLMADEGTLSREESLARQGAAIEKALQLAPNDAEALNRAGRYRIMAGDFEEGRALILRAIELDPDSPLSLATRAGMDGDLEGGIELQRKAVQLDPLGAVNRNNLASLLFAVGRYDESEAEYRFARDLAPARADEYTAMIALNQALQGEPGAALETAAGLPQQPRRWQVEAIAHHQLGQHDKAAEALARLQSQADVESAVIVAEVLAQHGDADGAVDWLETAEARVEPGSPYNYGWRAIQLVSYSPMLRQLQGNPRYDTWHARVRQAIEQEWPEIAPHEPSPPES